jgi:hypothetical protein
MNESRENESGSNIGEARQRLADRLALLLAKHWRRKQCEPSDATQGEQCSQSADQRQDTGK